jgi:predicted membrane channel-forming protein YqfA (hemolysin III family)
MQKHTEKRHAHNARYQLAGWILFIVCAFCYIISSLIHGDAWTFAGSVIFLMACLLFLVPMLKKKEK